MENEKVIEEQKVDDKSTIQQLIATDYKYLKMVGEIEKQENLISTNISIINDLKKKIEIFNNSNIEIINKIDKLKNDNIMIENIKDKNYQDLKKQSKNNIEIKELSILVDKNNKEIENIEKQINKLENSNKKFIINLDSAKKNLNYYVQKFEKGLEIEKENESELNKALEFCEQNLNKNYYYVQAHNRYFKFNEENGTWQHFSFESQKVKYTKLKKGGWMDTINLYLESIDAIKDTTTYSFDIVPPNILNLLSKKHWLKPEKHKEQHSKWFDILLKSLGRDFKENIEHIEQLIYWKHKNPSDLLPCVCWHGEGGVGKNVLMLLLEEIFGKHQVAQINFSNISGTFNEVLGGKTVVFFDESGAAKDDMDKLKQIVGNKTLTIRGLYKAEIKVDNTAMYFIGTQDQRGAISLGGDGSDRRWSILNLPFGKKLSNYVAEEENISESEAFTLIKDEIIPNFFQNAQEIETWLFHLYEKYRELETAPAALHGEDFKALKNSQKSVYDELFADIFDDNFEKITRKELFDNYKMLKMEITPDWKTDTMSHMVEKAKKYIAINKLNIKYVDNNYVDDIKFRGFVSFDYLNKTNNVLYFEKK